MKYFGNPIRWRGWHYTDSIEVYFWALHAEVNEHVYRIKHLFIHQTIHKQQAQ